jgi:hypothetical protein
MLLPQKRCIAGVVILLLGCRLKRLAAKVQKLDSEVSLQVRKACTVSTVKGRSSHDFEVGKLEDRIREKEKLNEAIRKQLMLIKYNPVPVYTSATRRPLSAMADYGHARQNRVTHTAAGKKSSPVNVEKGPNDPESEKILSALVMELERCKARLKQAHAEESERLAAKSSNMDRKDLGRWDTQPVEALRIAIKELETKIVLVRDAEESTVRLYRTEQTNLENVKKVITELHDELTSMRKEAVDMRKEKHVSPSLVRTSADMHVFAYLICIHTYI